MAARGKPTRNLEPTPPQPTQEQRETLYEPGKQPASQAEQSESQVDHNARPCPSIESQLMFRTA